MHYSLKQAADIIGVSYSRAWHAYAYGRVGWPHRVGKTLVLGEDDLTALKIYLDKSRKGDHHVERADDRDVQGI